MAQDLIYIGIVSSYSEKKKFIVLKDVPPDFPNIDNNIDVYFGFSVNFLQRYRILKLENRKTTIHLFFSNEVHLNFEKLLRMGVYVERKVVEKIKPDYYGPEDLLGAIVYDQNSVFVGKVVDVHILPSQYVIYVENDQYKIPLPFSEGNLLELNLKAKTIKLDLPEGYIDLAEKKG